MYEEIRKAFEQIERERVVLRGFILNAKYAEVMAKEIERNDQSR